MRLSRKMTWWQRSVAVLIATVSIAAGGVIFIRAQDDTTPVTAQAAIDAFRNADDSATSQRNSQSSDSATSAMTAPPRSPTSLAVPGEATTSGEDASGQDPGSSTTSPPPAAPVTGGGRQPGVYTYDTTGGEEIDALGGARHGYPASTTITIWEDSCGYRERWAPLEERWDEITTCVAQGGEAQRRFTTYHEFFGQADRQTYECPTDAWIHPPSLQPDTTWQFTCTAGGTTQDSTGQVLARETLEVQGQAVETVHLRLEIELSGDSTGTASIDTWSEPDTGLIIRRVSTTDTRSDSPFGSIRYQEDYTLHLSSLDPQR